MFEGELAISKAELTALQTEFERLQKALDLECLRKTWCLKHGAQVDEELKNLYWGWDMTEQDFESYTPIQDGDVNAAIDRAREGSE